MAPPTFRLLHEKDYRNEEGKKTRETVWDLLRSSTEGAQKMGFRLLGSTESRLMSCPVLLPSLLPRALHTGSERRVSVILTLIWYFWFCLSKWLRFWKRDFFPFFFLTSLSSQPKSSSQFWLSHHRTGGTRRLTLNGQLATAGPTPCTYSSTYNQWHIFKLYRYFWPTVLPHSYFNKYWLSTKAFQTLC